jgi:hypothetical protein
VNVLLVLVLEYMLIWPVHFALAVRQPKTVKRLLKKTINKTSISNFSVIALNLQPGGGSKRILATVPVVLSSTNMTRSSALATCTTAAMF